jgi:hypothetical protein
VELQPLSFAPQENCNRTTLAILLTRCVPKLDAVNPRETCMRLDLGIVDIQDLCFGAQTRIDNRVLSVNRQELVALLEQEPLFERVEIELAHPGESCRILRVLDVLL